MALTAFSRFLSQVTSAGVERTSLRAINRIPLGYHRGVYICGLQTQPPPVSGMYINHKVCGLPALGQVSCLGRGFACLR